MTLEQILDKLYDAGLNVEIENNWHTGDMYLNVQGHELGFLRLFTPEDSDLKVGDYILRNDSYNIDEVISTELLIRHKEYLVLLENVKYGTTYTSILKPKGYTKVSKSFGDTVKLHRDKMQNAK